MIKKDAYEKEYSYSILCMIIWVNIYSILNPFEWKNLKLSLLLLLLNTQTHTQSVSNVYRKISRKK